MARNTTLQLRCSMVEKERWHQAAAVRGMELSAWARLLMNQAAAEETRQEKLLEVEVKPTAQWWDRG